MAGWGRGEHPESCLLVEEIVGFLGKSRGEQPRLGHRMLSYCLPFPHLPWFLGIVLMIGDNQEPIRPASSSIQGWKGRNHICSVLSLQGLPELMLHL